MAEENVANPQSSDWQNALNLPSTLRLHFQEDEIDDLFCEISKERTKLESFSWFLLSEQVFLKSLIDFVSKKHCLQVYKYQLRIAKHDTATVVGLSKWRRTILFLKMSKSINFLKK